MRELILACIGILLQTTVFFCIGSLLMRGLRMKSDASFALILGYLTYFAVFEFLAVPMTLIWAPLKTLSMVWAVILGAVVFAALVFMRKQWISQIKRIPSLIKDHSWMLLAAGAVILLQWLIVVFYQDTSVDAAYYIGTVNTSVYTGTLGRYNPFNGNPLTRFPIRYVFSAYPMHNAVWCFLLGNHALVQSKIVMSVINVLIANLVIYQIGKALFHEQKKQADLMMVFVCLLNLFSFTIFTTGTFFFTRCYEGKAILGNISIPMVLLCSLWLWYRPRERGVWPVLFLTAVSALTFSGSSIIFPAVLSAGILPVAVMKKKYGLLLPYALCLLPSVFYAAVYFCAKAGLLTLKAF